MFMINPVFGLVSVVIVVILYTGHVEHGDFVISFIILLVKLGTITDEELKEQQALREEYLVTFRESMKNTIENVRVIDPNGEDVTPEKLKQIQAKRHTEEIH